MAGTPKRAPETEAALAGISLDEPASWERRLRGARAATSSPWTTIAPRRPIAPTVARNLLFKALTEIAYGNTRATRIVGAARDAGGGGVGP